MKGAKPLELTVPARFERNIIADYVDDRNSRKNFVDIRLRNSLSH